MPLMLHCFDPAEKSTVLRPLPVNGPGERCIVSVRALPGASAIHLLIESDDGSAAVRAECEAHHADVTRLQIAWDADNTVHVLNPSGRVFTLPAKDMFKPPKPLWVPDTNKLDLLFLVDGTAHVLAAGTPEGWTAHVGRLLDFCRALQQHYSDVRTAVVAFGDSPLGERVSAPDLEPRYELYPASPSRRRLEDYTFDQLREMLEHVEYTSGADFVDALAEGLRECRQAGWRADARKLLVVSGDSPGNSILVPAPEGADARTRLYDVDSEALNLHELHGVEILTIYLGQPESEVTRSLTEHAHEQYRQLATHRNWCWTATAFDPAEAARLVEAVRSAAAVGRYSSYGLLEAVEATD